MRKLLEILSLVSLVTLLYLTGAALYGPHALPSRIPVHFSATGDPDAWGVPRMLLLLPIIATGLYALITLVSRRPAVFNYPARMTPQNRRFLQEIALNMIAFLKFEVISLFALIQYFSIQTARLQQNALPPHLMAIALILIFATMGLHIAAMRRTASR
jgi:uncharacterized membrane protein